MTSESSHETEATDVMNEDEVVHVPAGIEELVESHEVTSTYLPDVPEWEPTAPSPAESP